MGCVGLSRGGAYDLRLGQSEGLRGQIWGIGENRMEAEIISSGGQVWAVWHFYLTHGGFVVGLC
jgi:hypothetical protein